MLLALLYTDDGFLAAAAPACDVQPYGDRYWREFYPVPLRPPPGTETAYVEIQDPALADRLLAMDFTDRQQAARAVDQHLFDAVTE